MATRGYIAAENVNITLLVDNHIDGLQFTIKDGGVAFDFSSATGYTLKIYDKRTTSRVLKATLTEATELSESGGVITWDSVFPSNMDIGKYYYQLSYTDSEGEKDVAVGHITVK